eukprot:835518-Amorphochlora_amoeboformis.AAC.1
MYVVHVKSDISKLNIHVPRTPSLLPRQISPRCSVDLTEETHPTSLLCMLVDDAYDVNDDA